MSDAARQYRQQRMLSADAALGKKGEDLAHRYLQSAGFTVLSRNYRPGGGESEVDIVAKDGPLTVFIEVKSRASADFGSPDRAIGQDKQSRIVRAARRYAARAGIEPDPVRHDLNCF